MQFMLDISRSMSKVYADLVANFISSLTNLVLLRRDTYLVHAHPNLNAFRLHNLRSTTISGGDLFNRIRTVFYCFWVILDPKRLLPPLHETEEGQGWTPVSAPSGHLLSTNAGTPIHGATALFSPPPQVYLQRRQRRLQGTWPWG